MLSLQSQGHGALAKRANRRLYDLLEARHLKGWGFVIQAGLFLLIFANIIAVVLETVEPIAAEHRRFFAWFEIVSVAIFLVEYILRLYACTAGPRELFHHPVLGRLRFALTPMAIVDLVAILPLFFLLFAGIDVGALRLVRILRVFKLLRYSPAMSMLARVVYNERKGLFGALVIFLILLVLSSTVVYYFEREGQPKTFGSIPDAMWWAMAALTTVGYGDVTPMTTAGRIVAGFVAILGIGAIALPTGIIASAFIEEHKRRDFTVTWQLLADVPFFQQLMAPRIADLVRVLRPRFVRSDEIVVRKGDEGDSMFIIASGEVEVELGGGREPVVLGPGQFFGEMALIERTARTATVRATEECKLLELNGKDFHELARHHPELKDAIHRIAAERKAANVGAPAAPARV
jgi:voltage-gated potassium channel